MSAAPEARLLALDLPPGEAFADALDAAWERGDAILPLDPEAPIASKRQTLQAMRPHAVIDTTGETAYADPAPLTDDVALVITTSGSTGTPKGVQLTRAALNSAAEATARRIGETSTDRWLSCLPWQHIGGLQVLLRARRARLPVTVLPRFDILAVSDAINDGATLTSLVPTTLTRLLDAAVDLAPLKGILLGGAAASPALLNRARAERANVIATYGMSETSGGCFYDGTPLDGVTARIADDGRIEIGGPTLMVGYRLRPDLDAESFTSDGWLRTSDLGRLDGDRLTVIGRADDIIVTGGEKVASDALAATIAEHPMVREAAVVGIADPQWGERVVAVVAGSVPSLAELREWLADQVPSWSLPRRLIVVDELPRLPGGKLDRLAIKARAGEDD